MPQKKSADGFEMTLRVYGYKNEEDGGWAAHCLETDLVGFGDNPEEAIKDLIDLTSMQVSFAHQMGKPGLIYREAPMHIQQSYAVLALENLKSFPDVLQDQSRIVGSIPLGTLQGPGQFAWSG